eukprot:CAMPEP_0206007600 /NCGR_PEP_ID=MMETSP1464-20131121/5863_1 /ASSEMBLY_ACC=CAM_ASM_001124 /TAXON_ID=119497 /ORGANISM="Exanthemachrysis gayraliae, Strain RCC1523" /LENGTH=76 /DNA_ID=CAMNT_0053381103 /DNA_START=182 /DNA_END=409 /DNA_ORIENTATION=-
MAVSRGRSWGRGDWARQGDPPGVGLGEAAGGRCHDGALSGAAPGNGAAPIGDGLGKNCARPPSRRPARAAPGVGAR